MDETEELKDEMANLKHRVGVLENAVGKLIESEMASLAPYVTKRWMDLDAIKNAVEDSVVVFRI